MGAVRRGYARRFGAAADTCCALRQCRFATLTLFVARFCLRVPSGVLGMCPSWAFCCAPWLDIPAGCSVVLSGPMMGIHYIQPIAFVTECRRFGLMQFPSSQHPFFILALRLFRHSRSLLSTGCKFGFCCIANVAPRGPRVALLGMRETTVNFYSLPSLFSRLLSSSLRACFGHASSLSLVPS